VLSLNEELDEIAANRAAPDNAEAFEIITIALGVERHARSMRLGTVDAQVCALAIVELLKQLPGLPK